VCTPHRRRAGGGQRSRQPGDGEAGEGVGRRAAQGLVRHRRGRQVPTCSVAWVGEARVDWKCTYVVPVLVTTIRGRRSAGVVYSGTLDRSEVSRLIQQLLGHEVATSQTRQAMAEMDADGS
jgi:hypothetical protein